MANSVSAALAIRKQQYVQSANSEINMLIPQQPKNVHQANLSFESDGKKEDIFRYTKTKRYYRFQYLTEKNDIMKNSLSAREGDLEEEARYKKQTDTESDRTLDSNTALHRTSAS